ncbi:hypothetical protein ElyMa_003222200 [Elysia marginata]|uniref:Uncharacterized protein n=1 Tax=Elysia marginata TaxID=1093978 RepID=A0AAV4J454_9GAST|nr:hypothetical protein ElyMa_003222200 [Elysia marginata]
MIRFLHKTDIPVYCQRNHPVDEYNDDDDDDDDDDEDDDYDVDDDGYYEDNDDDDDDDDVDDDDDYYEGNDDADDYDDDDFYDYNDHDDDGDDDHDGGYDDDDDDDHDDDNDDYDDDNGDDDNNQTYPYNYSNYEVSTVCAVLSTAIAHEDIPRRAVDRVSLDYHLEEFRGTAKPFEDTPQPCPAHSVKSLGQVNEGDVLSFILLPALFLKLSKNKHHIRCTSVGSKSALALRKVLFSNC